MKKIHMIVWLSLSLLLSRAAGAASFGGGSPVSLQSTEVAPPPSTISINVNWTNPEFLFTWDGANWQRDGGQDYAAFTFTNNSTDGQGAKINLTLERADGTVAEHDTLKVLGLGASETKPVNFSNSLALTLPSGGTGKAYLHYDVLMPTKAEVFTVNDLVTITVETDSSGGSTQ